MEPIKACFFQGLKNEKPTAEGRRVWHFQERDQRKNEYSEVNPVETLQILQIIIITSGQFGKNHLGHQDEMLPTNHGFDEFYRNLYHLNAEEEPETYYYPKNPEFQKNMALEVF